MSIAGDRFAGTANEGVAPAVDTPRFPGIEACLPAAHHAGTLQRLGGTRRGALEPSRRPDPFARLIEPRQRTPAARTQNVVQRPLLLAERHLEFVHALPKRRHVRWRIVRLSP